MEGQPIELGLEPEPVPLAVETFSELQYQQRVNSIGYGKRVIWTSGPDKTDSGGASTKTTYSGPHTESCRHALDE